MKEKKGERVFVFRNPLRQRIAGAALELDGFKPSSLKRLFELPSA